MERITFPDGEWIEVRDISEITERMRRPYLSAQIAAGGLSGESQVAAYRRLQDLAAVALIGAWSLPEAISEDGLADMPVTRRDLIVSVTEDRASILSWSTIIDQETMADPKATTGDSPSSEPGLQTPTLPPPVEPPASTPGT